MGYYGIVFPEYWTGHSGRALRQFGGRDAQLLGLYLATNRHANMLGLYRLLVDDIQHETGLPIRVLPKAFDAAERAQYARFDTSSGYVWVLNMARFRLGLAPGQALEPEDNKTIAVNRLYHAIDPNPFLGDYYDANHRILRIRRRREPAGLVVPLVAHHNGSGLPSPLQAPSKPGTEIRDQGTGTGNRKQEKAPRLTSRPAEPGRGAIRALVLDVVEHAPVESAFADLKDLAKEACARHRMPYDAEAVGSALEQAIARRQKRAH